MSVTRIFLPHCDGNIIMKDNGLNGFIIEYEDLLYYSELNGYPTLIFKCFDDYSKIFDIDCWLHFLYSEKCDLRNSAIRDDERMFYNNLKEVQKIVNYCQK